MGFLDGSKAELTWIREQRTLCLGVFRPAGRAFQSLTPSQKDSPPLRRRQLAPNSASLRLCDSSPQTCLPRRKVRAAAWTLGPVSA